MKKILFFFLFVSLKTMAQSVTILPATIDKQNSNLDDIKVTSFGTYPSIIGLRANGTVVAPTALSSGDIITQIGIRGFNGTTYSTSRANIRFKTTQAWTPAANGSSITFETTPNNSITVAQRMVINHDGNIGIGTTTPSYPLTFPGGLGDKISLWGGEINNTTNHYGMGIQSGAFQLFVPTTGDNFVYGVGRSASFSEKLRVTGNGNMQIQGSDAGYVFSDRLNIVKSFQWYSNAGNAYLYRQHNGAGNVMSVLENGNVGIGLSNPNASLSVGRGLSTDGTAAFFGTTHTTHFNYSTNEDTYIRGGKAGSNVYINDISGLGMVGVGTDTPLEKLHVNGNIRASGLAGIGVRNVLADANGKLVISSVANLYAFSAKKVGASNLSVLPNTSYTIPFSVEEYDYLSNYNNSTGEYTAPVSGVYHFDTSIQWGTAPAAGEAFMFIMVNGGFHSSVAYPIVSSKSFTTQISRDIQLGSGDVVKIDIFQISATSQLITNTDYYSRFSGHLVYRF